MFLWFWISHPKVPPCSPKSKPNHFQLFNIWRAQANWTGVSRDPQLRVHPSWLNPLLRVYRFKYICFSLPIFQLSHGKIRLLPSILLFFFLILTLINFINKKYIFIKEIVQTILKNKSYSLYFVPYYFHLHFIILLF